MKHERLKTLAGLLRAALTVACLLTVTQLHAAIVTFTGADPGVGPGDPFPNSAAAAASFEAAAGATSLVDFESAPLGPFDSLDVGSGLTIALANVDPGFAGISDDNTDAALGFNTTPGGSQFLRISPNFGGPDVTATFTFASPISSFGAYLTGTESSLDGTLTLNFNDGTSQTLAIPKNDSPGVQFFGFTDLGASISSIVLTEAGPFDSRDIFGVDDVRFGAAVAIPEPSTLLPALGGALVGLGLAVRRRRAVA